MNPWIIPYPNKPWRHRWRYLLSFYIRVIGFLFYNGPNEATLKDRVSKKGAHEPVELVRQ